MPGFNYNGEGAANMGLAGNGNGGSSGSNTGGSSPSAANIASQFNSAGGTQISASDVSNIRSDGNGGYLADIRGQYHDVVVDGVSGVSNTVSGFTGVTVNSNNGGSDVNGVITQPLILRDGQMGYWERRLVSSNKEHDHYQNVFVKVGPSEAEKAATAAKQLKEKLAADAAAKVFAAQVAATAALAEKQRQEAIDAAIAAGKHQTVDEAQKILNSATANATRLKSVYDKALSDVTAKQQSAPLLEPAAVAAESAYTNLQNRIRGMTLRNGYYGTISWDLVGSNKEHDLYQNRFHSSGITPAQVESARVNAVNKRNAVNSLSGEIANAQQVSLQAASDYTNAETARLAADAGVKAARQAEIQAAEAEQKRLAAEAAAQLAEEQKRQAEAKAAVAEQERIAAEQEKVKQSRQAAADKLKSTDIQSVRGIPATASAMSFPLTWAVASRGGLVLGADVVAEVAATVMSVIARLESIATVSLVGPVAAAISTLFFSAPAGDSSDSVVPGRDLSALMPGDTFSLPDDVALNDAADNKTGVDMPIRGRLVLRDGVALDTELVRTVTPGNVSVVRAVLDEETGYWGYSTPATQSEPSKTILVSPSDAPGVNGPLGLTGPIPLPEKFLHTGDQETSPAGNQVTVTPVTDEPNFNDLILIFPPESGLKPLYVMHNNPYGKTPDKGSYSGRPYNQEKAGGPVQNLDWSNTTIDQTGIDKVKLHTSRFAQSDANQVMIDRLEKILKGELQQTDTDKRFYTHEIRELERYRALGIKDGDVSGAGGDAPETWNNTHTATLEDFKLKSDDSLFYTDDAIKAAEQQEWRELE